MYSAPFKRSQNAPTLEWRPFCRIKGVAGIRRVNQVGEPQKGLPYLGHIDRCGVGRFTSVWLAAALSQRVGVNLPTYYRGVNKLISSDKSYNSTKTRYLIAPSVVARNCCLPIRLWLRTAWCTSPLTTWLPQCRRPPENRKSKLPMCFHNERTLNFVSGSADADFV
jgi:hypothetical protein